MSSNLMNVLIDLNTKNSICKLFNQSILSLLTNLENHCSTTEFLKIKTLKGMFIMFDLETSPYIIDEYNDFIKNNHHYNLESCIQKKDDSMIYNISSLKMNDSTSEVFNILSRIWNTIDEEFKESVWQYLELLFILSQKYQVK